MQRFEILRILEFFDVCLTKLNNNKILHNKINHTFPQAIKLFVGRKSLIYTRHSLSGHFGITLDNVDESEKFLTDALPGNLSPEVWVR
jgi:hypothetical protein